MSQSFAPNFRTNFTEIADAISGNILRGIEKEGLRLDRRGYIAKTPHPAALGSKLTNPYITTDFSEALLEFITPTFPNIPDMLAFLEKLHVFAYQNLDDELIWAASMPCTLTKEADIPIADYGPSNVGMMKTIYRRGLSHRYGKNMQTIAGIHFNFSLTDSFWEAYRETLKSNSDLKSIKNEHYLKLVRNFFRHSWLLNLLYGASPAACASFNRENSLGLTTQADRSIYGRYATSLRMSDIGYNNTAQSRLNIPYDSVTAYCEALKAATCEPHPEFSQIPIKVDGEYQQLNQNILQIEAEFYSPIRPKRTTQSGERPIQALLNGGVEYIEIRLLDINPFMPLGIDERQIKFLDAFLLTCLFLDSPVLTPAESHILRANQTQIIVKGRDPQLQLQDSNGQSLPLLEYIKPLQAQIQQTAELLDSAYPGAGYSVQVADTFAKLQKMDSLPSAQIIRDIDEHDHCFYDIAMAESRKIQSYFKQKSLSASDLAHFREQAQKSHQAQAEIEANQCCSLDEHINGYLC